MFKSGFVSIVGRPNVGKSTLMNNVVGEKIAIMSDKPQTTRNTIQAVYTDEECQIVFLDTPGIHKPKNKLGEFTKSLGLRPEGEGAADYTKEANKLGLTGSEKV